MKMYHLVVLMAMAILLAALVFTIIAAEEEDSEGFLAHITSASYIG